MRKVQMVTDLRTRDPQDLMGAANRPAYARCRKHLNKDLWPGPVSFSTCKRLEIHER